MFYWKTPVAEGWPLLASDRVMTNWAPVDGVPLLTAPVIAHVVPAVTAHAEPDAAHALVVAAVRVSGTVLPPNVMEALRTFVFAVPVLLRVTVQSYGEVAEHVAVAVTSALEVNDPNRPNTNPAMAMAAMRVMAMRMTVAMTGEIAFLRFTFVICIVVSQPVRPFK